MPLNFLVFSFYSSTKILLGRWNAELEDLEPEDTLSDKSKTGKKKWFETFLLLYFVDFYKILFNSFVYSLQVFDHLVIIKNKN